MSDETVGAPTPPEDWVTIYPPFPKGHWGEQEEQEAVRLIHFRDAELMAEAYKADADQLRLWTNLRTNDPNVRDSREEQHRGFIFYRFAVAEHYYREEEQ
jgi:hypothetical protein